MEANPTLFTAMKFLIGAVMHYDILSCVATGLAPQTAFREWFASNIIDLSSIMGCENWAMLAIAEVAEAEIESNPTVRKAMLCSLSERVTDSLKHLNLSTSRPLSRAATRVFATGVLVHLGVVNAKFGYSRPDFRSLVKDVIDAVDMMPVGVTLRGLTWSLCVAGCMAVGEQQTFFRHLMQDIIIGGTPHFTNCSTVLQIMEFCWGKQRESTKPVHHWHAGSIMAEMQICAVLA